MVGWLQQKRRQGVSLIGAIDLLKEQPLELASKVYVPP